MIFVLLIIALITFLGMMIWGPHTVDQKDNDKKARVPKDAERRCAVCGQPNKRLGVHEHCLGKNIRSTYDKGINA